MNTIIRFAIAVGAVLVLIYVIATLAAIQMMVAGAAA